MLYNNVDYKVSDFPLRISIIFTTQNIMATIAAGISITAAPSSLPDMSSKTGFIISNSSICNIYKKLGLGAVCIT